MRSLLLFTLLIMTGSGVWGTKSPPGRRGSQDDSYIKTGSAPPLLTRELAPIELVRTTSEIGKHVAEAVSQETRAFLVSREEAVAALRASCPVLGEKYDFSWRNARKKAPDAPPVAPYRPFPCPNSDEFIQPLLDWINEKRRAYTGFVLYASSDGYTEGDPLPIPLELEEFFGFNDEAFCECICNNEEMVRVIIRNIGAYYR